MARKVSVELVGSAASLNKAFKSAGVSANKFGKEASKSKRIAAGAFKAMGAGALVGGALVVKGLKDSIDAAIEAQQVQAQTAAALKSTGHAAGVTAKHISNLANALSQQTGIDDEAIQSTENLLLTFTKIQNVAGKGNKIFDQATVAVQDMSVALKQDAKSSAIQLGKALNDPIKGITALRRVGVAFNQSQVDTIKKLVATGHQLEAQKMILKEVQKEFGGSARAAGKTFGGQINLLKVNVENLEERIGTLLLPVLTRWARSINRWLGKAENQKRLMKQITHAARVFAGAMRIGAHWVQVGARVARRFSSAVGGWKNALAIVVSGLLVTKLLKVVRTLRKLRYEMLLLKGASGGSVIGPGGVVVPGRGGAGKSGFKAGLKSLGKSAAIVTGVLAAHEAAKAFSGPGTGNDLSQTTAPDVFRGSNPYPVGSPGYQAYRAGLRGMSPKSGNTIARDPAYRAGLRAGHHRPIHVHNTVELDGKVVAKVVQKHHERGKRRTAAQRGGRHPGVAVQ